MIIRERIETLEEKVLSPRAILSKNSQGRVRPEEPSELRTDFQRDRDRIIHCKSFRRLMHKTQVFISPRDHYRTRLTHTLEVAQIARTIAQGLCLNEDLTEAIALGHDLGHTPFGHSGEQVLNRILKDQGGFTHYKQSLRVVDVLEKDGEGLNLTFEVRDGILNHTGKRTPKTLEGYVVKLSDRIAYLNHDIDDALRGGIIKKDELPESCLDILGNKHGERINTMVADVIHYSMDQDYVAPSPTIKQAIDDLRKYMFKKVYVNSKAKIEDDKVDRLLSELYAFYLEHKDRLPEEYAKHIDVTKERSIVDYIAGMTDSFAVNIFKKIYLPAGYKNIE